jgi:formylglycine-generating enzyme required for sulfatase activity
MLMLYIPEGPFLMGNDSVDDEKPAQKFNLGAYWIDQTEVTNGMYAICVAQGKCQQPGKSSSSTRSKYYNNPQYADYPVIFVDGYMAKAYCIWAGAKLPSEPQWEKAARGTEGQQYPWGAAINKTYANFNGSDTKRVGSYRIGKSPSGAFDMAGNVWEWTSSLRWPYPYSTVDGREDITASGSRTLRGGSWNDVDTAARTTQRGGADPSDSFNDVGFRCASSIP